MHKNLSIQVTKERYEGDSFDTFNFNLMIKNKIVYERHLVLKSWSVQNYKHQWIEALERLKIHTTTCLVLCYNNTTKRGIPAVDSLDIFKVINSKLLFQLRPFASDECIKMLKAKEYNERSCYDFIMPFKTHNKHGWELDYWSCDYDPQEIDQLIAELKK